MIACPPEHSHKIAMHFRKGISYWPQFTSDVALTTVKGQPLLEAATNYWFAFFTILVITFEKLCHFCFSWLLPYEEE